MRRTKPSTLRLGSLASWRAMTPKVKKRVSLLTNFKSWPLQASECPPYCRDCMQLTHGTPQEEIQFCMILPFVLLSSWCVLGVQQAVGHLISPHAPPSFGYLFCTCFNLHTLSCHFCFSCMHLPPPLYVFVCTCVVSCRKTITVRILDREEYNKESSFYIVLETPEWRRNMKDPTGVIVNQ